ncbi:MAG: VWA domain-containing protein [Eggerthellaceae bacterium]|nr:VWA domain-containing protein [Eggerthellaceae bacterium]MBQ9044192.1 VWA domain-containing protein [Eggerthellaceae bacterium]
MEQLRKLLTLSFELVVVLLSTCFMAAAFADAGNVAYADEVDTGASRAIAIAYDNSGSMANGSDKWCNAQYSLEVLAAMMGDNDTLSLYAMDAPGEKLHLTGAMDAAERAKTVHTTDLGASDWTDPRATREAYQWLLSQPADEKYLVITTDGEFNVGGALDDVRQAVNEAVDQGIVVVYLAIGDQAELIAADEQRRVYVESASSSNILEKMTDIANLIFGRMPLDSSMYTEDGDLALEVPMSKIIVFAQGGDIEVGNLTLSDGSTVKPSLAQVRYRDRMTDGPNQYGGDNPNTNLQGVVATYDANLPKGEGHFDISGAESIEVYYQVNVGIAIGLTDDSGFAYSLEPNSDNVLSAGTYYVSYDFVDPDTGEELDSVLLNDAVFSLRVDDGAQVQEVGAGEAVTLERGTAVFLATAETADGMKVRQQYTGVEVTPPATPLNVSVASKPNEPVDVHSLDEADPIVVRVTKEDGQPLSQEEWDETKVSVVAPTASEPEGILGWFFGTPEGIELSEASQGQEPGTYEVRLGAYNGDSAQTLSGDVPLDISAVYDTGNGLSRGSTTDKVGISGLSFLEKLLNWLRMHILQLIILLILLLIIAFIIMELRKPRLPKLKPRISGVKDNEDLQLVYAQKKKEHTIWPPWAPETNTLKVSVKGQAASVYRLNERFPLGEKTIGIVAAKTKRGKKGVRLSDTTIATLDKHKSDEFLGSNEKYINPSYSGERQIFTPGGGFNFQGKKPHKKKGWSKPEEATYRITF